MLLNESLKVAFDDLVIESCTIMAPNFIPQGVQIGEFVILEPSLTFQRSLGVKCVVSIERGATIGAGSVLGASVRVGSGAVVQPGSVVFQDVPDNAIVSGNPAVIIGYTEKFNQSDNHKLSPLVEGGDSVSVGVGQVSLRHMKLVRDLRGDLSVGEIGRDIPFEVARYFLVFNVPNEKVRGEHAHFKCHQFLICVRGTCSVVVDDGQSRREVELTGPHLGLHLPPLTWGVQYKYSDDAVLLVLASHYYEAEDYIRNYDEFLSAVNR